MSMEVASPIAWEPLLAAIAFLVGAAALLMLEFFVVSFGLLLLASLVAVGVSVYFAFQAATVVGWLFLAVVPVAALFITRWGIARVQRSRLVPRAAVTGEAGYHHRVEHLGIEPGAIGEMVTPAYPSGRARFEGGECDVQAVSGSLAIGDRVRIERVAGPSVYVVRATEAVASTDAGT